MPDRENAVHALERAWNYIDVQRRTYSSVFKNNSFQTFDDVLSGIKTAIDLLKEQEPMAPKDFVLTDDYTGEEYTIKICARCDHSVEGAFYCPHCGQAVDWKV